MFNPFSRVDDVRVWQVLDGHEAGDAVVQPDPDADGLTGTGTGVEMVPHLREEKAESWERTWHMTKKVSSEKGVKLWNENFQYQNRL